MPTKAIECTACEGTGKQTTTITTIERGKPPKVERSEDVCFWCKGTKRLTRERMLLMVEAHAMWCECGNPSGEVQFYDNGQHPKLWKHHYRCAGCGKVTQIG